MNDLQIFNYNGNEVRTIQKDGEPLWVLKDVCNVLDIKNPTDVTKRLDADEVTRFNLGGLSGETNIINESGLYNVILRSDKPEAKPFRKWVTSEVLPSIRKTGGYQVPKTTGEQIQLLARGYTDLEQAVSGIKEDVSDLKENMPLYGCEIDEVQKHVRRKGVDVLGCKQSPAYHDGSIRTQVYQDLYAQIKREYGCVASYKSIKRKYIEDLHGFIENYEPPTVLAEIIKDCNAQMRIS